MAVGEEEEEPLDLDAFAVLEKRLQVRGSQVEKPADEIVDMLEALAVRELFEQLEEGALGRGECEGPGPVAPVPNRKACAIALRERLRLRSREARDAAVRRIVREEAAALMEDEAHGEREIPEPGRRGAAAVEVNLALGVGKEVRVALKLERRAAPDGEWERQEALQGYHDVLPLELAARAAVDAGGKLGEPAVLRVLGAKLPVIAALLQPGSIHQQPLRKELLELV